MMRTLLIVLLVACSAKSTPTSKPHVSSTGSNLEAAITPIARVTPLFSFTEATGGNPRAGLVLGPDGKFWGAAWQRGPNAGTTTTGSSCSSNAAWFGDTDAQRYRCPGSIFRVARDGSAFEVVHAFTPMDSYQRNADGYQPVAPLIDGRDGWMYGTTSKGGQPALSATIAGCGVVYRIHVASLEYQVLHHFCSKPRTVDGAYPYGGLVHDGRGNLFGVTKSGGGTSTYAGGVYKLDAARKLVPVHGFDEVVRVSGQPATNAEGGNTFGAPVLGLDGKLHGWHSAYGKFGRGTVWTMDPATGRVDVRHHFVPYTFGGNNDNAPLQSMIVGSDGALYGTNEFGGPSGTGIIFRVDENGIYTELRTFDAISLLSTPRNSNTTGALPIGTLYEHTDGLLYGTTFYGGTNGVGAIYRVSKSGSVFELVHSFTGGTTAPGGSFPSAGFVRGCDGALYSTTFHGGNGPGVIYRLEVD